MRVKSVATIILSCLSAFIYAQDVLKLKDNVPERVKILSENKNELYFIIYGDTNNKIRVAPKFAIDYFKYNDTLSYADSTFIKSNIGWSINDADSIPLTKSYNYNARNKLAEAADVYKKNLNIRLVAALSGSALITVAALSGFSVLYPVVGVGLVIVYAYVISNDYKFAKLLADAAIKP
jgi:hypothetical protein